ncbi:hypothetical protein GCM10009530_36960 [Microbispora corallina]|uniref:Uncharacterized protein n=1 Tax=Microbispora corallina TaxID=83302 RepID=A0ABQ4FY73_9ACTN|nr:hypothetical protein [Microbispora corallina]GIH39767.1 hypothetical protein Mco01_27670 [Microbispora corallina]
MARFTSHAEAVDEDHWATRAFRDGSIPRLPGRLLGDVLRETGGVYELTLPLTDRFRGMLTRAAAFSEANRHLLRVAGQTTVVISLEHLRGLDPAVTRVMCGCRIEFDDEDEARAVSPPDGDPPLGGGACRPR